MITHIHLENFKGFKERQTIELKPITLLFGPNSGGKSTVIQAIHYMREILERKNFDPDRTIAGGKAIDLGGFKNLTHMHDSSQPIILQFDLDFENIDLPSFVNWVEEELLYPQGEDNILASFYSEIKTGYVKIQIEWSEELQTALVTSYETGFNDSTIATIHLTNILAGGKCEFSISSINFFHDLFDREEREFNNKITEVPIFFSRFVNLLDITDEETPNFEMSVLQKTAIPKWGEELGLHINYSEDEPVDYEYQRMVENFFTRILVGPGELLLRELQKMRYIGPLRTIPARNYTPPKFVDDESWADGVAAWDVLYKSQQGFINKVNTWLDEKLKCDFTVRVSEMTTLRKDEPLMASLLSQSLLDENMDIQKSLMTRNYTKEFVFVDSRNGVESHAYDIGVGISQVLPVIVGSLDERSKLVIFEQPELHIHPAVQVNLGDLFISATHNKDRMIIAETHSEHLILRMLKRIEQTTNDELPPDAQPLKPEDVSVLWFEPGPNGIKVTALPIDETGEFTKHWPRGFFEERAEELFG